MYSLSNIHTSIIICSIVLVVLPYFSIGEGNGICIASLIYTAP